MEIRNIIINDSDQLEILNWAIGNYGFLRNDSVKYFNYILNISKEMTLQSEYIWVDDVVVYDKKGGVKRLWDGAGYENSERYKTSIGCDTFYYLERGVYGVVDYIGCEYWGKYKQISYDEWLIKRILE